jgi:peptidoglycan-associated lipoprotein
MKWLGLFAVNVMLAVAVIFVSCGKKKEIPEEIPIEETTPTPPADTTPVVKEEPPAPPKLKESQFQTIYFDFDKYNLRSDARAGLDKNYQILNEFPNAIIKIEGHCDERGTIEYNISLGEKRAKAAQDYLIGLGIQAHRISIITYGKERPVDPGHNEAAWAKNRRDEFRVISQ